LQYLEDPYAVLDELVGSGSDLVVVDLTIVNKELEDRVFLQHVPKAIYEASYPCYSLSENRLIKSMEMASYELLEGFPSISFPALDYIESYFNGYIFMRQSK